jgi:hypothetical protein
MRACTAIKASGERCRGIAGAGSDYCPAHDPTRAEQRHRAASKAAKSRHNPELREVKGLLKKLYSDVISGLVDRRDAAVAVQVANTQLRALELDRRMREHQELEGRYRDLEALLEEAEMRRYAGR